MPTPDKFVPPYNFQSSLGTAFGSHLDNSFAAVAASIASIIDLLTLIARSDGRLANSSVHLRALTDELKKFIEGQVGNWKLTGPWVLGRHYKYGDIVEFDGIPYGCCQEHSASDFVTDHEVRAYWQLLGGDTGLFATVPYVDTSIQELSDFLQGNLSPFETTEHAQQTYAPINSPVFTGEPKVPAFAIDHDEPLVPVNLGLLLSIFGTRNRWSKAQDVEMVVLPWQTTIQTDCSLSNVFQVTMLGNATLANPTNAVPGGTYIWHFMQGGSGLSNLVYGNQFVSAGGGALTLTKRAGAIDTITAAFDGQLFRCAISSDFKAPAA